MPKKTKKVRRRPVKTRLRFAAKVRAARAVLGWSQTELDERIGLTQHAIYQIEQAAVDTHAGPLQRL